jgi:hypothetical protein
MGKVRNIFSAEVGKYSKKAPSQRANFTVAKSIWDEADYGIICA